MDKTDSYRYVADQVYALSAVAFFVTTIGVFFLGHVLARSGLKIPERLNAGPRYLAYRGFRINKLRWNSASVGVLLLAAVGAIFFLCKHGQRPSERHELI